MRKSKAGWVEPEPEEECRQEENPGTNRVFNWTFRLAGAI